MKKQYAYFLLLVIFPLLSNAQTAQEWKFENAHSSINFSISHFFSNVNGKFSKFTGKVNFDPNNLKGSSVQIDIPVSSINTDNTKRDEHLQNEDFFDAQKFPEITFRSTSFKKISENHYQMIGNLKVKDVTKSVVIPFKVLGVMDNPRKPGSKIMGISGSTTINRTAYGVGTGNFATTSVLGDEVPIRIDMELSSGG